jgi:hypothetical protein
MYMRDGQEVVNTDANSGLYVRDRLGQVVRVQIRRDHIAFQIGEAMQVGRSPGHLAFVTTCVS